MIPKWLAECVRASAASLTPRGTGHFADAAQQQKSEIEKYMSASEEV
jgi:hypothetical protein